MITTAELVNLIYSRLRRMMPLVTDVCPRENTVLYTMGQRRYIVNRKVEVLELAVDKYIMSDHALYQQGLLRGGRRDDDGNLIAKEQSGSN